MKLNIPKEPKDLLAQMKNMRKEMESNPKSDWDSLIVWYGNQLPQYLWHEWKEELKPRGFTW